MSFGNSQILSSSGSSTQPTPPAPVPSDDSAYQIPLSQLPGSVVSAGSQVSPELYVDSYGAKGDGTTVDTAAVQAAVNAVNAAGGGRVRFTRGKTYVLGGVDPKANTRRQSRVSSPTAAFGENRNA